MLRSSLVPLAWLAAFGLVSCGGRPHSAKPREAAKQLVRTISFEHAGHSRRALVYRPASAKDHPPVVLAFHGGGGSADGTRAAYGLESVADKEGFVVVYPEGVGKRLGGRHFGVWGVGAMARERPETRVDDVGFIAELLDRLEGEEEHDATRVYATGLSNGSMMALTLACELSDRIAAVAGTGGTLGEGEVTCPGKRAVPTFYVAGQVDPCWAYEGGTCTSCWQKAMKTVGLRRKPVETSSCTSLADFEAMWSEQLGCEAPEPVEHEGGATCTEYRGCRDGATFKTCLVPDLGHVWPGGGYGGCDGKEDRKLCGAYIDAVGPTSKRLDLSTEAWAFFSRHQLPD